MSTPAINAKLAIAASAYYVFVSKIDPEHANHLDLLREDYEGAIDDGEDKHKIAYKLTRFHKYCGHYCTDHASQALLALNQALDELAEKLGLDVRFTSQTEAAAESPEEPAAPAPQARVRRVRGIGVGDVEIPPQQRG